MDGFERPRPVILPDDSLVPARNQIAPAPTCFSHEVTRDAPYWYDVSSSSAPDGVFDAGTEVLLVGESGSRSHVADRRGLYVAIESDVLRKLDR